MKFSIMISALLFATSGPALAGQNLPNLNDPSNVGRVTVFRTPKNFQWFLPGAFSSELNCPSEGTRRSCLLKVYNRLTPDETATLNAMTSGPDRGAIALSPLDASIVSGVQESFEGLPAGLALRTMKLQTLALNPLGPYASVGFRADGETIDRLAGAYASTGLGVFKSEVSFKGERIGFFVAVKGLDALKAQLLAVGDAGLATRDLNEFLGKLVSQTDLAIAGTSDAEARGYLRIELIRRFFKFDGRVKRYLLAHEDVSNLKELVLLDETSPPVAMTCTIQLVLKNGATPEVNCRESE